jgi:IS30 family transposase
VSQPATAQAPVAQDDDLRSRRKLGHCERLRRVVEAKLELRRSPQQISGWLVGAFPDQPEMRVSHETIYLSMFVRGRGGVSDRLCNCVT